MVEPSVGGSVFGGIVAVAGGIVWIGFASLSGNRRLFRCSASSSLSLGSERPFTAQGKASEFTAARDRYERRRREVSVSQFSQSNSSSQDAMGHPDRSTAEVDAFLDRAQQRANSGSPGAG